MEGFRESQIYRKQATLPDPEIKPSFPFSVNVSFILATDKDSILS